MTHPKSLWLHPHAKPVTVRLRPRFDQYAHFHDAYEQYADARHALEGSVQVTWRPTADVFTPIPTDNEEEAQRANDHIAKVAARMRSGEDIPPVILHEGAVFDGRHRIYAAAILKLKQVPTVEFGKAVAKGRRTNPRYADATLSDVLAALDKLPTEEASARDLRTICKDLVASCRFSNDDDYVAIDGHVLTLPYEIEVDRPESGWDFVNDASESVARSFGVMAKDLTEEIWLGEGNPPPLYHATTADNVDSILATGLGMQSKTRGIGNRGVGAAVFTTLDKDDLESGSYGDDIFEIDTAAMKRDGLTPPLSLEPEEEEREWKEALAARLDVEDFYWEVSDSSGISPSTVIVFGHIPAKYLKLVSSSRAGNPISAAAVAEWDMPDNEDDEELARWKMQDSIARAERQFHVVTENQILGCGALGCVVRLTDGRMLKITQSDDEVDLIRTILRLDPPRGFVRIYDAPIAVPFGWAYVRQAVPKPLDFSDKTGVGKILHRLSEAAVDSPKDYRAALRKLKVCSGFEGVAQLLQTLLTQEGIMLSDLKPSNMGYRSPGHVVLFDALMNHVS